MKYKTRFRAKRSKATDFDPPEAIVLEPQILMNYKRLGLDYGFFFPPQA
jgi:hypothetical protein